MYNRSRHGNWEIYKDEAGKLRVRSAVGSLASSGEPGPTDDMADARTGADAKPADPTGREREWAAQLRHELEVKLQARPGVKDLHVATERRLRYAHEITEYDDSDKPSDFLTVPGYKTDLLVYESVGEHGHWLPRVVIECKMKDVTTHDALTYSKKGTCLPGLSETALWLSKPG